MILFMGLSTDPTMRHAISVAHLLGVKFLYFDLLRFYREGDCSWNEAPGCGSRCGGDFDLTLPLASCSGIYARTINVSDHAPEAERDLWQARHALIEQVLCGTEATVVNRLFGDVSNFSKPFHLRILRDCGFMVPDTIVTSDPATVIAFCDGREIICKGVSSDKTRAFLVGETEQIALAQAGSSPLLLQERIPGADVRLHLVGDAIHAEAIVSEAVDYRFDKVAKRFAPVAPPLSVIDACRQYATLSGYSFIGFDFRMTHSGDFYVLEANPMPGYDAYDRRLGLEISKSLFRLLQNGE